MDTPEGVGRGTRWATAGAVGISALLPVMELGRVAEVEPWNGLLVAAVVVALCLPLHLRHVWYALHGRRAPRSGWSLAAMAALMGAADMVVSASWAYLLASLAVSVLLVVRPPWSLLLFGLTLGAVYLEGAEPAGASATVESGVYFLLTVTFRVVCLFAVIRLVAYVRELDRARHAVAQQAVEHHRAQVALQLTQSLGPDLQLLGERAARLSPPTDDRAPSQIADVRDEGRRILGDVRSIANRTRGAGAQRHLVDAGRLLRGDAVADEGPAHPAGSPAARLVGTRGRSWALLLLSHAVVTGVLVSHVAGVYFPAPLPIWSLLPLVLVLGVEFRLALRTARSAVQADAPWSYALGAAGALAGMAMSPDGFQFSGSLMFVGAAGAMAFRGRSRMAAVAAPVLVFYGSGLLTGFRNGATAGQVLWYVLYLACVTSLGIGSLYASARLVHAVGALETTRAVLAEQAVDQERRRFARDLHDTLVQSLSAIALTGDLALRLLLRDPAAAGREIDRLRTLADGLADDARRVGAAERTVTLAEEMQGAVQLLRAAGVHADVSVGAPRLSPEADAVLGWAVREAATNVVRHSAATRCAISVAREAGHVGLLVVNDGATTRPADASDEPPGSGGGNGLIGLADRVRALRGSLSTDGSAGSFRLQVLVPEGAS
ncbi:MAG TPA: histidine kinase [Blastococcus sp.]|nr:histidine kinase [Blastococcus sp.]